MSNCLFKKLKESVNNDNLPIYNTIVAQIKSVTTPTSSNRRLSLRGAGVIVETVDGSSKISTSTDFSNPTNRIELGVNQTNLYLVNGDYKLRIIHKYDLEIFVCAVSSMFDLSDLAYSKDLIGINVQGPYIKGAIETLNSLDKLTNIHIYGSSYDDKTDVYGDIGLLTLPDVCTLLNFKYTNISGSIETLVAKNLTNIDISGTSIYGDLKTWALNQWNNGNGRIDGNCTVIVVDTQSHLTPVTWDGQSIYEAVGSSNIKIVFSPQGVSPAQP